MTTRSPGDVPTSVDEPREPLVIDESIIGFSALDRLVDEPVTDKPAAPRTPRAAIAAGRIAAQPPAVAPAHQGIRLRRPPRQRREWRRSSRPLPESAPAIAAGLAFSQRPRVSMLLLGILLLLAIGEAAAIVMLLRRPAAPVVADSGSLAIATVPPGARVIVDDTDRGATPLTLTLPAGPHRAVLEFGGQRREISVNVTAGSSHTHHLEFASGSEVATSGANGAVEIRSATVRSLGADCRHGPWQDAVDDHRPRAGYPRGTSESRPPAADGVRDGCVRSHGPALRGLSREPVPAPPRGGSRLIRRSS